MKEFYLKNKPLIILWLLLFIALIIFCGHYSNILLDIGREVYYPQRILEGKVLYKDLFNIYGPFSYLWNAFLYKIFGVNLTTLYFSGIVCSFGIVSGIYLLAKRFLNTSLSFAIAFFALVTGVCADHLFNFTFPYSWAMLYGILSFIFSVYFLTLFKQCGDNKYFYLSGLLAGLAVANKYEFLLYAGLLFIIALFEKNKTIILNLITSLSVFPLLSFGILFIQGLRFSDIILTVNEIKKIMNAETLRYFYMTQGVFFTPKALPVWIISFLKTGVPFCLMILSYMLIEKNRIISIILISIFSIISFILCDPKVFVFLIPLLLLLTVCCLYRMKSNLPLLLFVPSVLCVSLKSFWGLTPLNYGNFYVSLVLLAFFSVLFCLINNKYQKIAALFLIMISLSFGTLFVLRRTNLNGKISSPQGTIYTDKSIAQATNGVLSILNNSEDTSSAFVYPEGLLINFLSKNKLKSDDYYNSMLPLYLETMGEDNFIKRTISSKPDFVIFNNISTKDYYFQYICSNYAVNYCNTVNSDYDTLERIPGEITYIIFQRKK